MIECEKELQQVEQYRQFNVPPNNDRRHVRRDEPFSSLPSSSFVDIPPPPADIITVNDFHFELKQEEIAQVLCVTLVSLC